MYSAIRCDEIIDKNAEAKSYDATNFNKKKATCQMQKIYILLAFLLITIALFIDVSIFSYLIKYRAKQKQLISRYK